MYTKKTLLQYNGAYDFEHRLTDGDVAIANAYKIMVEQSRKDTGPRAGDILRRKDGTMAHIEHLSTGGQITHFGFVGNKDYFMSICENPYIPFISADMSDSRPRVRMNTSGGPWHRVELDKIELEKIGTRKKTFCFFGHCGRRGNGAVHFRAKVNIWQEI